MKKTTIATAIGLCFATGTVSAAQLALFPYALTTDRANVTQLTASGGMGCFPGGGMNNVKFNWDGTVFTDISDYVGLSSVSNVTLSTTSLACGSPWTAHNVQMFTQGTYYFDSAIGGGNGETGVLPLDVGPGQIGMHLLLDWGVNLNMDVAMVFEMNQVFGSGIGNFNQTGCSTAGSNCLYNDGPASSFAGGTTANRPAGNHVWMFTSVDGNGDGVPGISMPAGGPFSGFNFNLNADLVPANSDRVANFSAFGHSDGASSASLRAAPSVRFNAYNPAAAMLAAAAASDTPLEVVHQSGQISRITMVNTTMRGNVTKVEYNGLSVPNPTVTVQTVGGCLPYTIVGPSAGCAPPYGNGNGFTTSNPVNVQDFTRAAAIAIVTGRDLTYAPFCWNGGCGEPYRVNLLPLP